MINDFDFNFEIKVNNILLFATRLRALMNANRVKTRKQ